MRKRILLVLLVVLGLISIYIILIRDSNSLNLSIQEKEYIKENKDKIFLVGYYPTQAEKSFSKKICEKVEEDTSLKLRIYDDTWNNTLYLLEEGYLPIVMNMIKTDKRSKYTNFTDTFLPIPCGIYSRKENPITSFKDIEGRVIGVEQEVALLETFQDMYPKVEYGLRVYKNFNQTRNAFLNNEIDGFLSSKSYDENVKGLYFYEIDSITGGTNHIGVNKNYPILYSILSKEVENLKEKEWDALVANIINFELEKSMVKFTKEHEKYIEDKESFVVGIPKEYFLYMDGTEYNHVGILAKILEKLEFILGSNLIFRFDSLENIRLRNDIDFYIDNMGGNQYTSNNIFDNEIVIIGDLKQKVVDEIYDLAPYKVGVIGVPNAKQNLLEEMPLIDIHDYINMTKAIKDIKARKIDYLIVPKIHLATTNLNNHITQKGLYAMDTTCFVSGDPTCIEILDECLSIIDINNIVNHNRESKDKVNRILIIGVAFSFLLLIVYIYLTFHTKIRNRYYYNNQYKILKIKYLNSRIKNRDVYIVLLEINNVHDVIFHYGDRIYNKYVKCILNNIELLNAESEDIFYFSKNKFLIIKNNNPEIFCNTIVKEDEIIINKVTLTKNISISYIQHFKDDNMVKSLDYLEAGINMTKSNSVYFFDEVERQNYINGLLRMVELKKSIIEGEISTSYKNVVNKDGQILANYIIPMVGNIRNDIIRKNADKYDLEVKLDKRLINHILNTYKNEDIIIDVFETTLLSENFFPWFIDKCDMNRERIIYLLTTFECYENNIEIFQGLGNNNIRFIISDFGKDIVSNYRIKYYEITYILLDSEFEFSMNDCTDILEFILTFANENNKEIICRDINLDCPFYIKEETYEGTNN